MSEDSGSVSSDSMELPPAAVSELNLQNNGPLSFQNGFQNSSAPHVEIIEHPQQRGFRFRYRCEGPSHGGLQGEHSERGNKTYPTIKIHNHSGPAIVMVTLVTDEKLPRTHAHELMGKHCQNGICIVEVRESPTADTIVTFPNLGILHVTKKKVEAILRDRISESMKRHHHLKTSNFSTPLPELCEEQKEKAAKQAKDDSKKMTLNVVRLCFQVYLQDQNGFYSHLLDSVISKPIFDSKCPGVAGLNICRMDRNAGCSIGNDEVFLLCDKVQKDDILVRFFEKDEEDHVKWEAFGNFGPSDVHRQYAIVFKTPPYRDPGITAPVQVMVQLRRISDHETSEPKPFTYFPQQLDKEEVGKKRRKLLPFETRRYRNDDFQNGQHGTGGPGVSICSGGFGGSAGSTNNTGNSSSGGRVNNYAFTRDMLGCASGPSHASPMKEMHPNDPQMAASSMHQPLCLPQMQQMQLPLTNQQMFNAKPQLPDSAQLGLMNSHSQQPIKPMEITPEPAEPTLDEIQSFLEGYGGTEALMAQTAPINMTTLNDQQHDHQQRMYRQQPHLPQQQPQQRQYIQQQQQPGFPQMAQMAPMAATQQTMQTAAMTQSFATNPGQIPPPPQYTQVTQQSPYSPAQGQYSPASQQAFSPSPQQSYSPASQQAFSPGAQQAFSPGAQQAYSPGSTQSYSPGGAQQQQPQQFSPPSQQQYSPNSQHQYASPPHQQASPPTTRPYLFPENDLLTDGGDVDADAPNQAGTDGVDDVVCDAACFEDPDLQVDAVPMSPSLRKPQTSDKHEEEYESLMKDIEKISLVEKPVSDGPEETPDEKEDGKHGEEHTEQDELAVTIPTQQSMLDLQLAMNVAKRSLVALHNYSKTGDPVYLLLCQRHLISVQDDLGDTALHMAIIHRQTDVAIKLLRAISTLSHSASDIVNTCNILRQTPLQLAVLTAQAHLIPLLLAQGANRHLLDKDGNTPLHLAARKGYRECISALLSGEFNTNQRQLEALNFDGFSALHLSIHHCHFEAMKVLLERGANINQKDGRSGRTALHHAVEANDHNMAGYILLKTDVDVNASSYDRNTALHMAVGRRLYNMAKLLVASDANPEAESSELVPGEYEDDIVEDSDEVVEDGEDLSDDGYDITKDGVLLHYVRPIDLAQNDLKMLRILSHDDIDPGFEDDLKLKQDNSTDGDLSRLDRATLEALSEKLDAVTSQAGWPALADGLGLMSAMDRFRDEPSPTRHLLDTYKAENGTLKELRRVLNAMERYDAAALVDKFITSPQQTLLDTTPNFRPEINDLSKRHLAGSDSIDLGYRSASLGSFS